MPETSQTPQTLQILQMPQMLSAYEWALLSVEGVAPITAPLRLRFDDQRVQVLGLCNSTSAAYSLQGQALTLQAPHSTLRHCAEEGLMALEQRVLRQLPLAQTLKVEDSSAQKSQNPPNPTITIGFADSSQWRLRGHPTAQTRYGGPGERVFLEVAAEKIPCAGEGTGAGAGAGACLRVRTVQYNDSGLKTAVGPWESLSQGIEGYTHHSGTRKVLRLQRYRLQGAAPTPAYAYVLDMVVESALERAKAGGQ